MTRMFILLAAVAACAGMLHARRTAADTETRHMNFGGRQRVYLVYRPSNVPATRPLPLVIAFHGGGGDAEQMKRHSGLNGWADKLGFMVVYPEAIDKHWNDGRRSVKFREHDAKIDDVAWIGRLLDRLEQTEAIDGRRIYVVGPSNGGMMAQRTAIELGDRLAAAATIIASLPEPLKASQPRAPISMLIINGTDDPLMPYGGGPVTIRSLLPARMRRLPLPDRGRVLSTAKTAAWWRKRNGISAKGSVSFLPDRDRADGCRVKKTVWSSDESKTEVILYEVMGGGHGIPGTRQYLPRDRIGNVCQDFDAMEVVCRFFLKHQRAMPVSTEP